MERLYWKMRYAYEEWYFNRKYGNERPGIYYDKKFRVYINPRIPIERSSSLVYVCCETVRDGIIYNYVIEGRYTHAHMIDEVFKDAYNYAESFEILDEQQYSNQELNLIKKLKNQGMQDK